MIEKNIVGGTAHSDLCAYEMGVYGNEEEGTDKTMTDMARVAINLVSSCLTYVAQLVKRLFFKVD